MLPFIARSISGGKIEEGRLSYWRTFYHLVWATHNREAWISQERIAMLQQAFRVVAQDQEAYTYAVGGVPDHVHVVVSIPPTISVSEYVQRLKGSSSRYLNKQSENPELDGFAWQRKFFVISFGERSLSDIISYVEHQPERHASNDLWPSFEELGPRTQE